MKRGDRDDDTHRAEARGGAGLTLSVSGGGERLAGRVRAVAEAVLAAEGLHRGHLDIAVVNGPTMRRLHAEFLDDDSLTDVLSFDLRETRQPGRIDGQIIVCAPVARQSARERGGRFTDELLLYVVHGCLHLAGYDDRTAAATAAMHAREDELLTRLGIGPVFQVAPKRTQARPERRKPSRSTSRSKRSTSCA